MNNISPWSHTAAMQTTVCPKCKSKAGELCKTPKGKKAETHMERCKQYRLDIGSEE